MESEYISQCHQRIGVHLKPCTIVDFYMAYISQPIREDYHLYLLIRLAGMCTPCRNLRKYKASGVPLICNILHRFHCYAEIIKIIAFKMCIDSNWSHWKLYRLYSWVNDFWLLNLSWRTCHLYKRAVEKTHYTIFTCGYDLRRLL